jgi:mannose-6-phosphate isomerase
MEIQRVIENSPYLLSGRVQKYAWGGYHFIPDLVGLVPEPGVPYAEYWMGAHDKAPSGVLLDGGLELPLNRLIKDNPQLTLGNKVAGKFGQLPFLFKVLDVHRMLSIQVHPNKAQAEEGFARENSRGLPLDSGYRNYKDTNHKPELQVALSDYWLLQGFKPESELRSTLASYPEFHSLLRIFSEDGYRHLYQHVMEMPPDTLSSILGPLAARIMPGFERGELPAASPDYWAARVMGESKDGDFDRGIFSIYFFNLVMLKPGQAVYHDSGTPHASLMGQVLEIMANSDNVVRGGLTPKFVDVPELLSLISFRGMMPGMINGSKGTGTGEWIYPSPAGDFSLSRIHLAPGQVFQNTANSAEIWLIYDGVAVLDADGKQVQVKKGESLIVFAGKHYQIKTGRGDVELYRASTPEL